MNWWYAILFFLVSPGVLLTLPPGSRGVFMSRQTSLLAAAVHAIVFIFLTRYIVEGFTATQLKPIIKAGQIGASCKKSTDCKQGTCDKKTKKCIAQTAASTVHLLKK
jgi:hypothetical protein